MRRALSFTTIAILAPLVMLVMAAPAGARVFDMVGHSTVRGCNADVPVRFEVWVSHGQPKFVHRFRAKGFGYPNRTPPVPVGSPRGNCYPGYDGWYTWLWDDPDGPADFTLEIPFGTGQLNENEFKAVDKHVYDGRLVLSQTYVEGTVNVTRRNGEFHAKSHGAFLDAVSEGGLIYGGSSTGRVTWKAHAHND
jgi:hypothetical protein